MVGVIPWLITGWEFTEPLPYWAVARWTGAVLIAAGLYVCAHAFTRFVAARGVPIPAAPTEHLVVDGFNRYVRNPMYVALLHVLIGEALLFGSLGVLAWALTAWLVAALFVRFYEEPTLERTFGADYTEYRRNVRAWVPRLRPWRPSAAARTGR
ncbi:methyltransferase family protein [Streptomonospora nanhaiensis]|uniref:methyltransferase family protein n=1 Tax=Streptomonospora nanhaiensis TaxID=1323731 RepID=UPI001C99844C|nr:isoprenylcysteine carboxylmethyltransferase family protein [Streptomonospora nanhaiensis]MBX9391906.1 isoprenylcysteine carboxylmethyltransferase family protein [Streptomonospora nanhaiensis]